MRRIAVPAAIALRDHWRHAALVVVVGAAALAVAIPIGSLAKRDRSGAAVLTLDEIPAPRPGVRWTTWARAPTEIRQEALGDLLTLLAIVGCAAVAIAIAVILTRALVHIGERAPEFGIRRAVGASRRDVLCGLLGEATVVATVLVVVGVVAGRVAMERAVTAWPSAVEQIRFTYWLGILAVTTAVLVGWLTALRFATRRHLLHPHAPSVPLWIPAAKLGLAIAILTAGALVLERARALTPGQGMVAAPGATVVALDTGELAIPERARRYAALLDHLDADREVAVASLTAPGALLGLGTVDYIVTNCGNCFSAQVAIPWHSLRAIHHFASPDTFTALGATISSGRGFTRDDRVSSQRVVVVNRHLASRHFDARGAIGRDLYLRAGGWDERRTALWGEPYSVIGVVDDDPSPALGGALQPREAVYLSSLQHPPARAELLVRARGDDAPQDRVVEAVAVALGPGYVDPPVLVDRVLARERRVLAWFGVGFGLIGVLALVIAIIGVFDATTAWVRSLAFELGLRRAVGATKTRMASFVLFRVVGMALGGVSIGALAFTLVVRKPLSEIVPGIPLWAPHILWPLAGILVGAALLGSTGVVVRSLREQPAARLR